jgi:hypothetical protein
MPSDQKPTADSKNEESKPASPEERRRIIEDYANGLREIIEKLRRRFN